MRILAIASLLSLLVPIPIFAQWAHYPPSTESATAPVSETWKGTFADSLASGTAQIIFDMHSDGSVSGTYRTSAGGLGTVQGKLTGNTLSFTLTQTVEACPGSFKGNLVLQNRHATGHYTGQDCQGKHLDGVISMARAKGASKATLQAPVSSVTREQAIKRNRESQAKATSPRKVAKSQAKSGKKKKGKETLWLTALAYRVIPQTSTYNFQYGQQSSYTSCFGQGYDYGAFATLNLDCNTRYSSPAQIPITWTRVFIYNLLETASHRLLVSCSRNWRWSKCSPLVPGEIFNAEFDGKHLWVTAYKLPERNKKVRVKYDVLQAEIK